MAIDSYILDTSAYSAFNRQDERLRPWFHSKYIIHIPFIVIGELRAGFAAGSKTEENEILLERFLDTASIQLLPLSLKTTECFAQLFKAMRQAGRAIASHDLWIAALALEHNLPILTLDQDFSRIKGIKVLKY